MCHQTVARVRTGELVRFLVLTWPWLSFCLCVPVQSAVPEVRQNVPLRPRSVVVTAGMPGRLWSSGHPSALILVPPLDVPALCFFLLYFSKRLSCTITSSYMVYSIISNYIYYIVFSFLTNNGCIRYFQFFWFFLFVSFFPFFSFLSSFFPLADQIKETKQNIIDHKKLYWMQSWQQTCATRRWRLWQSELPPVGSVAVPGRRHSRRSSLAASGHVEKVTSEHLLRRKLKASG